MPYADQATHTSTGGECDSRPRAHAAKLVQEVEEDAVVQAEKEPHTLALH